MKWSYEQAIANARGIGVMSGEAIEAELVRDVNAAGTPACDQGHATEYSHAVGACRCPHGALVRMSGTVVRRCGR